MLDDFTTKSLAVSNDTELIIPESLTSRETVSQFLSKLLPTTKQQNPAAALVPWICERLPSEQSRQTYASVIRDFLLHLKDCGHTLLSISGDDIRIFREALRQAGMQPATIAKQLSVIRGMYRQFGKRGLMNWETVQDIQAVESPKVQKNLTPILTEQDAKNYCINRILQRSLVFGITRCCLCFLRLRVAFRQSLLQR